MQVAAPNAGFAACGHPSAATGAATPNGWTRHIAAGRTPCSGKYLENPCTGCPFTLAVRGVRSGVWSVEEDESGGVSPLELFNKINKKNVPLHRRCDACMLRDRRVP
eukprot:scaffold45709_cov66-Phaeocystis_antarctica.AAC.3